MVFTQGIDYISDTAAVRKQASNVLGDSNVSSVDFPDVKIQAFQTQAYSLIRTVTDKDDWDYLDREFYAIQRIEVDLADAYIRKHFKQDYESAANATIAECMQELQTISDNMDTPTGAEEVLIARTDYKSWNLNPDVAVPRGNLRIN